MCAKQNCIWNPSTRGCENGKNIESIIGDSVIMCNEIIEVTKTVPTKTVPIRTISAKTIPTNFNKKKGNL